MSRRIDKDILPAILTIVIVGLGLGAIQPLVALTMHMHKFSPDEIGTAAAIYSFSSVIMPLFVAPVLRRVPIAYCVILSIFISSICIMSYGYIYNIYLMYGLRFIHGGAVNFLFIICEYWINRGITKENRGYVVGVYATLLSLSFCIGPLVLLLTHKHGNMLSFEAIVGIMLAATIPIFLSMERMKTGHQLVHGPTKNPIFFIKQDPISILSPFFYGAIEMLTFSLLPVYVKKLGYSYSVSIFSVAVFVLGSVFFQIPAGLLCSRIRPKILLFVCATTGLTLSFLLLFFTDKIWIAAFILFVNGGFVGGLYTISLIDLGNTFEKKNLVSANASFAFYYAVGSLVGPFITGWLLDYTLRISIPLAMFGFCLIYVLIILAHIMHALVRHEKFL